MHHATHVGASVIPALSASVAVHKGTCCMNPSGASASDAARAGRGTVLNGPSVPCKQDYCILDVESLDAVDVSSILPAANLPEVSALPQPLT